MVVDFLLVPVVLVECYWFEDVIWRFFCLSKVCQKVQLA